MYLFLLIVKMINFSLFDKRGEQLMTKAEMFFNEIKEKKIAFIGTGVSHNELIRLFLKKGYNIVICDKNNLEEENFDLYNEFKQAGAKFSFGENYLDEIFKCDIVFRTPGMYYNNPTLIKARKQGVIITSEMEVFFDLCPCKIYAITGSDGKSTTTTLVSEFFKAEGKTVHLGGNIGKPLLYKIEKIKETDIAVVELSSFQLISMRQSPYAAAITNISENHLNVHGTMEEYIGAKCNILAHQNAFSKTVLNMDNDETMKLCDLVRGKLTLFSRSDVPDCGSFLDSDGNLCYNDFGKVTKIVHMNNIRIPGIHNVENFLTAIALTWGDVSTESIVKTAKEFGGVEHRIEFVRELDGVKYYNDSIATSPNRVMAGLNSFNQKIIVIAGGSDKGIPFDSLAKPVNEKVKVLILMGDTAEKIEKAVTECDEYKTSGLKVIRVKDMDEAVHTARDNAQSGDIVSLSPACPSFDMYPMFEVRGRHFKEIVNSL